MFQPPALEKRRQTNAHKVLRAVSRAQPTARPRRWRSVRAEVAARRRATGCAT
ncbi:unnamed protein product [Ectocarpus sp. 6 AP-2014]